MREVGEIPAAPADSIVIDFKIRGPGDPLAIVIGPGHAPYYLLETGGTRPVAENAAHDH